MVQHEITQLPIDSLIEDPQNARLHGAKNLAAIKSSLQEFGQVEPLVVQKGSKTVIGGNGRLSAMKALGWETVTVMLVDLDDKSAKALGIALNRTAELGEWNTEQLAATLQELLNGEQNLAGLGWSDKELEKLLGEPAPDLPEPEALERREGASKSEVSHIRMAQLFFTNEQLEAFYERTNALAERYGTDNLTDTVTRALDEAIQKLG